MMPIVDGLEAEFGTKMTFVRLDANVSPNDELLTEYGVRGHPSVAILDGRGAVTARFFGPVDADTLRTAILDACPECAGE